MIGVLIAIILAAGLLLVLITVTGRAGKSGNSKNSKRKNTSAVIKDATKRLSHNPRDVPSLTALGDIYYTQPNYEKAYPLYKTLCELSHLHTEIDEKLVHIRYGVCAFKTQKIDEAGNAFSIVLKKEPQNFEANFYIGKVLYEKKDYEKTITFMKRAAVSNPDNPEIVQALAYSLYHSKKYREALPQLRKILDVNPTNKEALFYMASSMEECNMGDKALKIFMHLRPDPQFGAQSCLSAGNYHAKIQQYDKAVQDYEIALKLENVPPETRTTVMYKLALTYLANNNNIAKALGYLKQIQSITPNYRDVSALIARYQELNSNANLQAYLMSGTSDFVALCRKFVTAYYPNSFVKIEDLSVASSSIEILCNVQTSRWEDTELFRFFRTTSAVGELYVRELHSKMRDIKCDKGFCVTAGGYTEEAKKYVEGRPIDLVEKTKLVAVLKKIDLN